MQRAPSPDRPPPDQCTDAQLWAGAAAGDRTCFEEVYRRHHRAVWNHALRMTASRDAAEDVTSSTFLTAWRKLDEVRFASSSARPWLMGVAANLARSHRRQGVRHDRLARRVGPQDDVADHAEGVVGAMDSRRRLERVLVAVESLPARHREVVDLHLVGGVSTADTARALGLTEATVRARTSRARARLRDLLQEDQ